MLTRFMRLSDVKTALLKPIQESSVPSLYFCKGWAFGASKFN
jgi:hypothetical protein